MIPTHARKTILFFSFDLEFLFHLASCSMLIFTISISCRMNGCGIITCNGLFEMSIESLFKAAWTIESTVMITFKWKITHEIMSFHSRWCSFRVFSIIHKRTKWTDRFSTVQTQRVVVIFKYKSLLICLWLVGKKPKNKKNWNQKKLNTFDWKNIFSSINKWW